MPVTARILHVRLGVLLTTISTLVGNSTLPPTWSGMRVDDRRGSAWASALDLGRESPSPSGFFVSTTTTPAEPTKTAVLPPPFNMNRLSRNFWTSTTLRGAAAPAAPPQMPAPETRR
jgi:hypothetical protein